MSDEQEPAGARRGALLSVMMAVAAAMAFTVFLILITGGFFLYVVFYGMALVGFVGFHYLVWGKMLTGMLRREMEEARLEERAREERRPSSTAIRQR